MVKLRNFALLVVFSHVFFTLYNAQNNKRAITIAALLAFFVSPASATCWHEHAEQVVRIDHVVDGDTVMLDNGRRARLVGINTPEIALPEEYRDEDWQHYDQPLAREAKQALESLLFIGDEDTLLIAAQKNTDRYGRQLVHLRRNNTNIARELISRGLAFAVTLSPNTTFSSCYHTAEHRARHAQLGVWQHPYYSSILAADFAAKGRNGFVLVNGRVSKVTPGKSRIWIDLDDTVAISLSRKALKYFQYPFMQLHGQIVQVRGWIVDRKKPGEELPSYKKRWMVSISHPSMIAREQ